MPVPTTITSHATRSASCALSSPMPNTSSSVNDDLKLPALRVRKYHLDGDEESEIRPGKARPTDRKISAYRLRQDEEPGSRCDSTANYVVSG